MLEVVGLPIKDNEDYLDIIYKVCELVDPQIKNSDIEVAHRMKKGDIIVKFMNRHTPDRVYKQKKNFANYSTKDIGYTGRCASECHRNFKSL